jgi:hypothetical protein
VYGHMHSSRITLTTVSPLTLTPLVDTLRGSC